MAGTMTMQIDSLTLAWQPAYPRDNLSRLGSFLQFARTNVCGVLPRRDYGRGNKRNEKKKRRKKGAKISGKLEGKESLRLFWS